MRRFFEPESQDCPECLAGGSGASSVVPKTHRHKKKHKR